jgi:hypothetical protein
LDIDELKLLHHPGNNTWKFISRTLIDFLYLEIYNQNNKFFDNNLGYQEVFLKSRRSL